LTIINVYCVENHHIRMISELSCDTEDWSYDAEMILGNKLIFF